MAKRLTGPDRLSPQQIRQQIEQIKAGVEKAATWTSRDGQRTVSMAKWTFDRRKKLSDLTAPEREQIEQQHSLYKALQGQLGPLQRMLNEAEEAVAEGVQHVLDQHKPQLLEWFGRYTSAKEVHRRVVTELGLTDVSYQVVLRFADRNAELVREKQRVLRTDTSDLGLTHKRGRLEVLHRLVADAEQQYELTGNRDDYRLVISTLEQIRKEVEGDRFHVDIEGQLNLDVQATIRLQVAQQLMKDLNPQFIVLARLAAARGLDPLWLMTQLQTSYYAKLNGSQNPGARLGDAPDFVYPSQQPYDWKAIENRHAGPVTAGAGGLPLAAPVPAALPATSAGAAAAAGKAISLRELMAARTAPPPGEEEA